MSESAEQNSRALIVAKFSQHEESDPSAWHKRFKDIWARMGSPFDGEAENAFKRVRTELSHLGIGFNTILETADRANTLEDELAEALSANADLGQQNHKLLRENKQLRANIKNHSTQLRFRKVAGMLLEYSPLAFPALANMTHFLNSELAVAFSGVLAMSIGQFRLTAERHRRVGFHASLLAVGTIVTFYGGWQEAEKIVARDTARNARIDAQKQSDDDKVRKAVDFKINDMLSTSTFGDQTVQITSNYKRGTAVALIVGRHHAFTYSYSEGQVSNHAIRGTCDQFWSSSTIFANVNPATIYPPYPLITGAPDRSFGDCKAYNTIQGLTDPK